MLVGTEITLKGLTGEQNPTIASEAEYIVVFESGRLFITDGYEDVNSLVKSIERGDPIHGSYYWKADAPWQDTRLSRRQMEAIIDLRKDSTEEDDDE